MSSGKVRRGTPPRSVDAMMKKGAPLKAQVGRCPVCNKLVALGSLATHIGSGSCR